MKITQYADLSKLENPKLASKARSINEKAGAATVELGKILAVLDSRRGDQTLQKFARAVLNTELDSTAYKVAVSFGIVGEGGIGSGTITESEFDLVSVRWHSVVSSGLNYMAKEEKSDEFQLTIREQMAVVLRERPEKGYDTLRAIVSTMKPTPASETDKNEASETESTQAESPESLMPVDVFSGEFFRFLQKKIESETDIARLTTAMNAFRALSDLAEGIALEKTAPVAPAIAA